MIGRLAPLAAILTVLVTIAPWAASASRIPLRPDALKRIEADAIVLVQVKQINPVGGTWTATASIRGMLEGRYPDAEINFGAGDGVITSGYQIGKPKIGWYYVLYLRKTAERFLLNNGFRYWFARASGDLRLSELDTLLPWGAVRMPKPDELRLIEIAEPRFLELTKHLDLSAYTRIYVRRGPSSLTMLLLRSRTPQRLMLDAYEEGPTRQSCGCDIIEVTAHLNDLLAAGALPPFDP